MADAETVTEKEASYKVLEVRGGVIKQPKVVLQKSPPVSITAPASVSQISGECWRLLTALLMRE